LIKIISGVHTDYEGEMRLQGEAVRFHSPADAKNLGIGTVYQELSVIPSLSVAENLFLGQLPVSRLGFVAWRHIRRDAEDHLARLGLEVDINRTMGSYSLGVQQMVEVARVLFSGAKIIIMDEPTSALSAPEAEHLFQFIARLKEQGSTIIYISHFLEDVLRVADRVTVMKNGQRVGTYASTEVNKTQLIQK
jgi:ribose transport system ATP-binding protein